MHKKKLRAQLHLEGTNPNNRLGTRGCVAKGVYVGTRHSPKAR